MPGLVAFNKEQVRKIIEHTEKHPEMTPTFESMAEERFWKPGTVPDENGWAKSQDVDVSKIEPYITLVKDQGIYLMAGSRERMPGTETLNFVVYGEGFGPKADYDKVRMVAGGDDFGEHLPLSMFKIAMEWPGEYFGIKITENNLELVPVEVKSKPKSRP